MTPGVRVAADTGGTFTDVVATDGVRSVSVKLPSTPADPARAVLDGTREALTLLRADRASELVHGTTVATNALLAGRGAPAWFVTNRGFEDLLVIGRQARPTLFDLQPSLPPPIVPRDRILGVGGRRGPRGESIAPLDLAPLRACVAAAGARPRSWAVCLLHAYADGCDERAVRDCILDARPADHVSLSHEVVPRMREVERGRTVAANAVLLPLLHEYLGRLRPAADRVAVMGSAGGWMDIERAREFPVHTVLSGPAGGILAVERIARRHGYTRALSLDMGGTSTDVALCDAHLSVRPFVEVGGQLLAVPSIEIHTVGAGGGSIAWIDDGGALRVGPGSAAADPGPACYGRGTCATLTDADVVLGRLPENTRLAGRMPIFPERAFTAVRSIADQLRVSTEEAAQGILALAVERTAQAVRNVSVARGIDPRGVPLVCFGGAGALHACDLAELLGISCIIVPPDAGLLCAVGMLGGAPVIEDSATVLGRAPAFVVEAARRCLARAIDALPSVPERIVRTALARFAGQSHELEVSWDDDIEVVTAGFRRAHELRYGYALSAEVEIVAVRARVEGAPFSDRATGRAEVCHGERGEPIRGPHAEVASSFTAWIAPGWIARRCTDGSLRLERA